MQCCMRCCTYDTHATMRCCIMLLATAKPSSRQACPINTNTNNACLRPIGHDYSKSEPVTTNMIRGIHALNMQTKGLDIKYNHMCKELVPACFSCAVAVGLAQVWTRFTTLRTRHLGKKLGTTTCTDHLPRNQSAQNMLLHIVD